MKIAFFGTPKFSQIVLEKLINTDFKPDVVITAPDAKSGRGQKTQSPPTKETALANNIELLQPKILSEIKNKISKIDLAILVAYGKILPKDILGIPKYGFINIHPSLLPKHRGPSPIHSAILSGDEKTGVSIMLLDEEVDHGPLLAQSELKIDTEDTHDSLAEKLATLGTELLLKNLPAYISSELKPVDQNHKAATFTQHITKQDGYFDIQEPPAKDDLDRMIRAYYPWPTAWTRIGDKIIKFLPGQKVQPEGKKPMSIKEYLNGNPKAKDVLLNLFH